MAFIHGAVLWKLAATWPGGGVHGASGYLLAQRLAQGETIRENENSFPFLDMIFR